MIESGIRFLEELDKLKAVERRSYPIGLDRRENSAEHSWSLAMAVMTLAPTADPSLDLLRATQMALLHDIVEIDAGDTFVYADQTGKFGKELAAAERIFGLLPPDQATAYQALWQEFETGSSVEARFVRALDRLLPLILNFHAEGRTWREHGIRYEQVFARNRHIADGSEELWTYALKLMDAAVARGWLPKAEE